MGHSVIADAFKPVESDLRANAHSEYWLMGGRGSTKSSFISIEIMLGIWEDERANAIVYRRVGNTLKDSVYEQLIWAIDTLGMTQYFRYRRSPLEIERVRTGQRILFRGADDPMKSKSIRLKRGHYFKYLWLEELTEFRGMEDVRTIKQSVFRGVSHAVTFYSYNPPKSAHNWVNQEALKRVDGRLVHASSYLDVPPEWLGERFLLDAEALKKASERAYRNEYLGEVTGTGGQVFDNLELRAVSDDEISGCERFFNGLDFGFAVDPDALTRWAYSRKTRTLIAVGEYYGSHTPLDVLADKVKALAGRETVQCDSEDARTISELRRRGVSAIGVKKGPGSVRHGMRWLEDLGKILIDPKRTPNIAREFSKYEYAQDKNGNFLADYPDADNHCIDSARYALSTEIDRRIATTRNDIY